MCHRHYDLHAEALRDIEADLEATDDEPEDAEERAPAVADD